MIRATVLLLILFSVYSCSRKPSDEIITIRGLLKNSDIKEIMLNGHNSFHKTIPDVKGEFFLQIREHRASVYMLNKKYQVFLIPGDSLNITISGNTVTFSGGQSAILSNYWKEHCNKLRNSIDKQAWYAKTPDDFARSVFAYMDSSRFQLKEFQAGTNNINQEFLDLENERIKYYWLKDIMEYEKSYKNYNLKDMNVDLTFFDTVAKSVNLNNPELLQLIDYKDFLFSYAFAISNKIIKEENDKLIDKYDETDYIIDYLSEEFTDKNVFEYVLYRIIKDRTIKLQVNTSNLKRFKQFCSNNDFIADVESKYVEFESILPGMPAPDFSFYDAKGKEYNLKYFEGKYLLIDLWTPFCGSCIREMPALHEIDEEFNDEEITFITVCLHKNTVLWLGKINELELQGLQLIDKAGWDSRFRVESKIPWFPIFMLIDKEGNFIDARAPRPSENLREVIAKTLNTDVEV